MNISRREILLSASAAGALTACAPVRPLARAGGTDAATLLSETAEALLASYPENASALGLDDGARAALKSRLTDRSPEGQRRLAAEAMARLAEMKAVDRGLLDSDVAANLDVAQAAHELAVDGFRFPFGDVAVLNNYWSYRNAPYVVAQNTGAFVEIPDFLDSQHGVENAADAEAYLERLEAYADALDGETERLRHDAGLGVIAPAFLLDKTLGQMKSARSEPIADQVLVKSLAEKTASLPGDYAARAERIVASEVAPALDRQIAELEQHRTRATADAGVWKLPDGDAYYAWTLRAATTSTLTPDEVHQTGLDQLADLQGRMDVLLRAEGLTQGTVGERMTALGKDPRYLYPNTQAGRQQILDYVEGRLADIRTRLPRAFATLVPARLVVKRVPPAIEEGAPGAYAGAGSIDGTVPGNYYINLRDTAMWPRYSLPTVTYHEGIPGHIWAGEYSYKLPLIRSLLSFNAYSEGWALYAEQLADELGVYDDDPLGRLGYLQALSFRACRLVVDSGLHAKRWTRDHAIQWFASTNGSTIEEVQGEVDRYCAWPGQACGYKIGHSEINRLRAKAQATLGDAFDFRLFNDTVVKAGGVPLTVLERIVDSYIAATGGLAA